MGPYNLWSKSSCWHLDLHTHSCMQKRVPLPRKIEMEVNEKRGQTALVRCRAWPSKHAHQPHVYMQPHLIPYLSLFSHFFPPKQSQSIPFPICGPSNHPIISPIPPPQPGMCSGKLFHWLTLLGVTPGPWGWSCLSDNSWEVWVRGSVSLIKNLNWHKAVSEFPDKAHILEIKYRKSSRKMWRSVWMQKLTKKSKPSYWCSVLTHTEGWFPREILKDFCWMVSESLMSSSHVDKTGCDVEVSSASFPQRQQLTGCFWVKSEVPV